MENQPETPTQTPPAAVDENPVASPPAPSKLPLILLVILLLFLSGVGGISLGKYLSVSQNNLPIPTLAPKPTVVPTVTPDVTSNWKTYTNPTKSFEFKYPSTWTVSNFTVVKGERKQRANKYDINAVDSDIEVIDINNDDNTIEIETGKLASADCGGQGPNSGDILKRYKFFTILNQKGARKDLENGYYWSGADTLEPYPQPIMFPVPVSDDIKNRIGINGEAYNFKWCPQTLANNLFISMTYYSNQFTKSNIENKKIDPNILREMDDILKTLQLL